MQGTAFAEVTHAVGGVGGCCLPARDGAACVLMTEEECAGQEGLYHGEGVMCGPSPCLIGVETLPNRAGTALVAIAPNPVTTSTRIQYELAEAGEISLDIYDVSGRLVRRLFHGSARAGAGSAEWNGCKDDGGRVPAGSYFCRLTSGSGRFSRELIILE